MLFGPLRRRNCHVPMTALRRRPTPNRCCWPASTGASGGLAGSQRAAVAGLAQSWIKEGTGAIVADVPVDTPNSGAAAALYREIRSILTASGVPANGIALHRYHPDDVRTFATIRLS